MGGISYEKECMFRENPTGGMSTSSCLWIATSSCEILYSMTSRASVLRSAKLRQYRCPIVLLTISRGVMAVFSNIPSSHSL